jgi:hypothetical protein
MLQASTTTKQAIASHERSPVGRALLRLRQSVQEWIDENTKLGRITYAEIQSAEMLRCNLYSAAVNGLAIERASLLEAIDRMEAAPSGRRG